MKKQELVAYLKGREAVASETSHTATKYGNKLEAEYFKGRADAFLTIADYILI
jgi:hypothetical protein